MNDSNTKQNVKRFYNQIGWQKVSEGTYQNAQYEDLRPVSREYIHKCHLRINRFLKSDGKYLLDAGSGPIQYPEYLTYSKGYQFRVCLDISIVALQEAQDRIGSKHGLFVVADVANLPFADEIFDGIVSLHTLHHLTDSDYVPAYKNLKRVLKVDCTAVIVNGWDESVLMHWFNKPVLVMERIINTFNPSSKEVKKNTSGVSKNPKGTFVHKLNAQRLRDLLGSDFPISISVWRSVSVRFLRAMIHPMLLGKIWLWMLFRLEEMFPTFFGEKGQYPLITFTK
ncbi:MAG: class I SAM-dependent methyltransferase [Anaerolineaceae bacterium]|nr:class I SAM-dependent methyltransferase [Anaerolineaceae bacterium]